MRDYLEQFKQYLYDKEILPIIKRASKFSAKEIAERMVPVPYESMDGLLPIGSSKMVRWLNDIGA